MSETRPRCEAMVNPGVRCSRKAGHRGSHVNHILAEWPTPARPAGGEPRELLMENGEREVLERVIARLDRKALLMPFVKLDVGAFDGHGRLDVEQTRANLLAWLCAAHGGSEHE